MFTECRLRSLCESKYAAVVVERVQKSGPQREPRPRKSVRKCDTPAVLSADRCELLRLAPSPVQADKTEEAGAEQDHRAGLGDRLVEANALTGSQC